MTRILREERASRLWTWIAVVSLSGIALAWSIVPTAEGPPRGPRSGDGVPREERAAPGENAQGGLSERQVSRGSAYAPCPARGGPSPPGGEKGRGAARIEELLSLSAGELERRGIEEVDWLRRTAAGSADVGLAIGAVALLGRIGCVPTLLEVMSSGSSAEVRSQAIGALRTARLDPRVEGALVSRLCLDRSREVRASAAFLLGELSADREYAYQVLVERMRGASEARDREVLVRAIGLSRRPAALSVLLDRIEQDPSPEVREAAYGEVEGLAGPAACVGCPPDPRLIERLRTSAATRPWAERERVYELIATIHGIAPTGRE